MKLKKIYKICFQVLYCENCRESCHPKRGPLATHKLGPAQAKWQTTLRGNRNSMQHEPSTNCADHPDEIFSLYCALCKVAACGLCLRDRHNTHHNDILPLTAACKAQKVKIFYNTIRNKKKLNTFERIYLSVINV